MNFDTHVKFSYRAYLALCAASVAALLFGWTTAAMLCGVFALGAALYCEKTKSAWGAHVVTNMDAILEKLLAMYGTTFEDVKDEAAGGISMVKLAEAMRKAGHAVVINDENAGVVDDLFALCFTMLDRPDAFSNTEFIGGVREQVVHAKEAWDRRQQ